MPYAAGRVFHDADSHVMEPADWLVPFADAAMKDRLLRRDPPSTRPPVEAPTEKIIEGLIGGPKGRLAYGAHDSGERIRALEELGFSSQLVFPTSALRPFRTSSDQDVLYAGARAANKAMAAFCRDPRSRGGPASHRPWLPCDLGPLHAGRRQVAGPPGPRSVLGASGGDPDALCPPHWRGIAHHARRVRQ